MVDFSENFSQYAISKLPTFRDNFTIYADQAEADASWVSSDTAILRVNPTTDKLDFTIPSSILKDDAIVHDLGENFVSDRNWTLRFKLDITAFTGNTTTSGENIGIILSDSDETFGVPDNQNWIGLLLTSAQQISDRYALRGQLNSDVRRNDVKGDFIHTPIVETLYWEIKRISKTKIQGNVYSDEKFTDLIESVTNTEDNITGLRYLKVTYRSILVANTVLTGTVENIEFWNEGTQVIFQDDFSTSVNWTEVGNGIVTITGGVISGWGAGGSSVADNRLTHDLGTPLSDSSWKMEFEYRFTASIIPSHPIMYITDKDQDPDATSDNDVLGISHGTAVNQLKMLFVDNGDIGGSGTSSSGIPISSSTTYFVRLERVSTTLAKLSVFSDSGFTNHIAFSPVTFTIPSTVDGLQYVQSSNGSQAGSSRTLTGTLDNLVISDELIGDTEGAVTIQDNFSSYPDQSSADLAWVPQDSSKNRVNIVTDVLDLNILRDNTNDAISHDLGSTVSDSNWVLRFKLKIDTLSQQALQTQGYFGLFDQDGIAGEETVQSGIGVVLTCFTGTLNYRLFSAENQLIPSGSSTIFTHALAVETVYVEIKRTSLTSYVVNLYSDADFSTLIESQQGITSSGVNDLRFIGMKNNMSMTVSSFILGSMDNVEVYDGVSVARTPVKTTPPDFEDSFWEDNWTDVGAQHGVNTSTRVIDWDSARLAEPINQTTFDLETIFPNGVNPDKWALRFRFRIDAITPSVPPALSQFAVYLTSAVSGTSSESAQDHCTWKVQGDNPPSFVGMVDDATQIFTGASVIIGFDVVPVGETGYGEMTRDGNIFTWAIYSDPDFTQLLGSSKQSVNETVDAVSGLRFLKIGRRDGTASAFTFNGTVDNIQFWNGNNPTEHGTKWVEVNIV